MFDRRRDMAMHVATVHSELREQKKAVPRKKGGWGRNCRRTLQQGGCTQSIIPTVQLTGHQSITQRTWMRVHHCC
jgi:hypothetical protein